MKQWGQATDFTLQRSRRLSALIPSPALDRSFRPVLGREGADRIHDGDEHRGPVFFIQGDDRLDLCPVG